MITIPTTELIGCLTDVLPIITDPKSELAGVQVEWDGESLHFTAYDVYSGGTVEWPPGLGAEGEPNEDSEADDPEWGGDDAPWSTWIRLDQVKDILKLFKLPAKLWRFPVTVKCSPTGDRLIIEREDGPRVGRQLMLQAEPGMLAKIPNVRTYTTDRDMTPTMRMNAVFTGYRLAAFGAVRPHGLMHMEFGQDGDPVAVNIGSRYRGFIYPSTAKHVPRFNLLRDGAGVHVSRQTEEPAGD